MSMSIFGSFMGDMDNDPFFGSAMRQMQSMDNMMNSLFQDPFGMFRDFEHPRSMHNSLLPSFPMPMMPSFNRLMSTSLDSMGNCTNYSSSSTVVSMTSGPDGRPQVYKATSSTRLAPGGIKETQKTVSDSISGTKKMSIGHHIGERAHIIEKEQNVLTGDREEREDFINLDEDEAEEFNKEWETKTRCVSEIPRIAGGSARNHPYGGHSAPLAITAGPSSHRQTPLVTARRSIKSGTPNPAHLSASSSRTPYSPPGAVQPRKSKNVKSVSKSSTTDK